jgi:hypothetical protein
LADSSTEVVQRYLNWNEKSKGALILKRVCGALVLLGGLYMIYTAPQTGEKFSQRMKKSNESNGTENRGVNLFSTCPPPEEDSSAAFFSPALNQNDAMCGLAPTRDLTTGLFGIYCGIYPRRNHANSQTF